jgi:uncharacterized membrane protein
MEKQFFKTIQSSIVTGLLIWIPIWVIFLLISFLIDFSNESLHLLPNFMLPESWLGEHIPGFGTLFAVLLLFITGSIAKNIAGKKIIIVWERLISKIPVIRSIHSGIKKALEFIVQQQHDDSLFGKVVMIEFPRKGIWSLAFLTGKQQKIPTDEDLVSVFVSTPPNPITGFLLFVPKKDIYEIDISVDSALETMLSLGTSQMNPEILKKIALISKELIK